MFSPELFIYNNLLQNSTEKNLIHAFSFAEQKFGIEKILDPEGTELTGFFFIWKFISVHYYCWWWTCTLTTYSLCIMIRFFADFTEYFSALHVYNIPDETGIVYGNECLEVFHMFTSSSDWYSQCCHFSILVIFEFCNSYIDFIVASILFYLTTHFDFWFIWH